MEEPQQTTPIAKSEPLPFNLTEVDLATLAQTDEEFSPHSWGELKDIVGGCCLDLTHRAFSTRPSGMLSDPSLTPPFLPHRSERPLRFQALPFSTPPVSFVVE